MGLLFIIDDDEAMLTLLAEFFMSLGYDVETHRSAESAVNYLSNYPQLIPHAVISDVNMPIMDGIEFLQWMQGKFRAPIILISAFGSGELEKRALDAGAAFFMKKPFALSALKKAVESLLKAS